MIVPYVYSDARQYYETIFYAEQANKNITEIEAETTVIKIAPPQRRIRSPRIIDLDYLEEELMQDE